eukprot:TRINITY_DN14165_c0_g1_i1.p1 TRINITY_DN14165_c0_g1~~TRINITY_DN14165_c0_g1_i1.p1  ORF type:complete len:85 (+),score=21.50 TRINITY_DN14165_c0_g1_i1:212-466(+)
MAVRLKEVGPRITLKLLKIEEGINDGKVLFDAYVSKTERKLIALRKGERIEQKRLRKKEQRKKIVLKRKENKKGKKRKNNGKEK